MAQDGTVVVVGAGLAGLVCAQTLAEAGRRVHVFDKGRRPGGRISTRRAEGGFVFNHGAQFVTANGPALSALIGSMAESGAASPWAAAGPGEQPRYSFSPGMYAFPATVAERAARAGATIEAGRHVGFLHRGPRDWFVRHFDSAVTPPSAVLETGGELAGPFDTLVLAIPTPQAAGLLRAGGLAAFAARLDKVVMAPCWTLMLGFPAPLETRAEVMRPVSGPLRWIVRETSRPGREAAREAWTVHADTEWSRAHLEKKPGEIVRPMLDAFRAETGCSDEPALAVAHRWRFSFVERALDEPCLYNPKAALAMCGDWCIGARAEAAWESGEAAARAILSA